MVSYHKSGHEVEELVPPSMVTVDRVHVLVVTSNNIGACLSKGNKCTLMHC